MASKFGIGTHRTTIRTTIAQDNDSTVVTYHSTVVTYHSTEVVSFNQRFINLRSGGYRTVTTKRRMNEASKIFGLGFRVYQVNYDWFVDYCHKVYMYQDGMTLDRETGDCSHYPTGDKIYPLFG